MENNITQLETNGFSSKEISDLASLAMVDLSSPYLEYLRDIGFYNLEESYYLSKDGKKGWIPLSSFYNYEELTDEIKNFMEEEELVSIAHFKDYIL